MLERVLIIVSCHFAYWQYSNGDTSVVRGWNSCRDESAYVERERQRLRRQNAWKARYVGPRVRPRPLPPPTIPAPTWAYDFGRR